jgi:hypothetical protein
MEAIASRMFVFCVHTISNLKDQVRKMVLRLEEERRFVVGRKQRSGCTLISNKREKVNSTRKLQVNFSNILIHLVSFTIVQSKPISLVYL